jgi:branched-chain amino acid transport system ATP-binding protein
MWHPGIAATTPPLLSKTSEIARTVSHDTLISVRGVSVNFGGIKALDNLDFDVPRGAVCGIIGPNGSGKTTLFNCLSRIYEPTAGTIIFDGHTLSSYSRHHMAELGIGRTFQNVALCNSMSVRQNVMLGAHCQKKQGFVASLLRLPKVIECEKAIDRDVDELLHVLELDTVAHLAAGTLPFGTRKKIELARALASKPKLLLLDEPAAGLNHEEVEGLRQWIRRICDEMAITVLLVEHHMNLVMRVSDKVVALEFGKKIAEGSPDSVSREPAVMRAYLGAL